MARKLSDAERDFVQRVKALCLKNYGAGGDVIIECFEDEEIANAFTTIRQVQEYCGMQVERELNARWGGDDDPELQRAESWKEADWD